MRKKKKFLSVSATGRKNVPSIFPAVAAGEEVTAGIAGTGNDHGSVRRAPQK